MTRIIQTRGDANGDVHWDFSGFVGEAAAKPEKTAGAANWRHWGAMSPPSFRQKALSASRPASKPRFSVNIPNRICAWILLAVVVCIEFKRIVATCYVVVHALRGLSAAW